MTAALESSDGEHSYSEPNESCQRHQRDNDARAGREAGPTTEPVEYRVPVTEDRSTSGNGPQVLGCTHRPGDYYWYGTLQTIGKENRRPKAFVHFPEHVCGTGVASADAEQIDARAHARGG